MPIESSFVATPFGRFHVEAAGEGKPMLFIHGGTASAREWRLVLPDLGEHARCVAVDRLGCGLSDRSPSYDRVTLTRSLLALADALGWERFGVAGQSFGGFWALSLAYEAPERISRLVIVNSGSSARMTEAEARDRAERMAAMRNAKTWAEMTPEERGAAADRTIASIYADPRRVPASYRDDLLWQMEQAAPGQLAAVAGQDDHVSSEALGRIECPTLVVWGEADSMGPPERGRRLASAIPGARFIGLPGVGHTCQIEAPREFVAAVAPFLEETDEVC
jgi:pimeloyl-ACP methyl ester carboxylesterase